MKEWYDIKDQATMGSGKNEIKEVMSLERTVRWIAKGGSERRTRGTGKG